MPGGTIGPLLTVSHGGNAPGGKHPGKHRLTGYRAGSARSRILRAAVRHTDVSSGQDVARVGHIDKRKQADVGCALRSGTPA
jgi:hypothetical protein